MRRRLSVLGLVVVGIALLALVPSAQTTPTCFGKPATIVGTNGDDVPLNGTAGNDVIVTLDGNDLVHAGNGDDLVCGNGGNDSLAGEGDNDKLSLGPKGSGPQTFPPFDQDANGGEGNDLMVGADSSDDQLQDPGGDNVFKGLTGNDTLLEATIAPPGFGKLYGGGGNDTLNSNDNDHDFDNGGGGTDTCNTDPCDTVKKCP